LDSVESGVFTKTRVIRGVHGDFLRGCASDPVRGGFLTFSSDGTSKYFDAKGDHHVTYEVSRDVNYGVAVTASGHVVVGGEGKNCKVFDAQATRSQSLPIPSQMLSVASFPNGDVATGVGGKGSFIEVWSSDPSRQLAGEDLKTAQATMASAAPAAPQSQGSSGHGIPASMIKPFETLQAPGASHGANVIVLVDGAPNMYQWSETEYQWELIGPVSAGSSGEGSAPPPAPAASSSFDVNVTVDLGNGRSLPLGFNRGSDPFAVAVQFVMDNGLPELFLPQIEQYVRQLM
jgi:hypothetical protein